MTLKRLSLTWIGAFALLAILFGLLFGARSLFFPRPQRIGPDLTPPFLVEYRFEGEEKWSPLYKGENVSRNSCSVSVRKAPVATGFDLMVNIRHSFLYPFHGKIEKRVEEGKEFIVCTGEGDLKVSLLHYTDGSDSHWSYATFSVLCEEND